jgi:hypothetical protein
MRIPVTWIAAPSRHGYLIRDRFRTPASVLAVHVAIAGRRNPMQGPGNYGRQDISVGSGDVGIRRKVVPSSVLHVFTSATVYKRDAA